MPKNLKLLFCFLVLFGVASLAYCGTFILQLKNGDRLTGTIISETTNDVTLTNLWIKSVTIPLSEITKREKVPEPLPAPVVATNAPAIASTNINSAAVVTNKPAVVIATNAPAKPATNAAPVAALPPIKEKGPKRWTFDLQLGVSLQYNQRSYQLYYGTFKANYAGVRTRDMIDYKFNYGRTDGLLSANNMNGSWRIEYDITKSKRAFLFNVVGAGYDEVRKVDFTYDESVGAGYKLVERTNLVLSADAGFNYQQEFFQKQVTFVVTNTPGGSFTNRIVSRPVNDYISLRLGETASWKVNPRLTIDQKAEFYPRISHFGDYRARAEMNLSYKLNPAGSLYVNFTVIDAYDTQPAIGVTPNDLQIRSTLGWKF